MVNGRITLEQLAWLEARADELGGNLSAALRQAITDARFLDMAREDYKLLREQHPEFSIPPHDDPPHESRILSVVLSGIRLAEVDDIELRELEAADEA